MKKALVPVLVLSLLLSLQSLWKKRGVFSGMTLIQSRMTC